MEEWRFVNFGTTLQTTVTGNSADPDGDGEVNLLEFATGQNPNVGTRFATSAVLDESTLDFTYPPSVATISEGVGFTVEWSETMEETSLSSEGVSEKVPIDTGSIETVNATMPAGTFSRFVRLRINQ